MTIWLGRLLPDASSALPGSTAGHRVAPLCGLAPSGVWPAGVSPRRWWALTPPFHPYQRSPCLRCSERRGWRAFAPRPTRWPPGSQPPSKPPGGGPEPPWRGRAHCAWPPGVWPLTAHRRRGERGRCSFCATFRRIAPPGCYPALCPVELGLSSPGSPEGPPAAATRHTLQVYYTRSRQRTTENGGQRRITTDHDGDGGGQGTPRRRGARGMGAGWGQAVRGLGGGEGYCSASSSGSFACAASRAARFCRVMSASRCMS